MYIIYKCTNTINDKSYIGFTNKPLQKRINEHKSSANRGSEYILHKSIVKHGFENFIWEVVYRSDDKDFTLNIMETYCIKKYNTHYLNGMGYNMTLGGQAVMLGRKHDELTKTKMKHAWKNRAVKITNPNGFSQEAIEKSANIRRGKPSWNRGKICSSISENNFGHRCKGKKWYKDVNTGKRVWV